MMLICNANGQANLSQVGRVGHFLEGLIMVSGVFVGVRSARHIANNIAALRLELDQDDFDYIDEVLRRAQGPSGDIYSFERARF